MKKKILFISWDSATASYAEGLFMPIFSEIQNKYPSEFHYLQFSPAKSQKVDTIARTAERLKIKYQHIPFKKLAKPFGLIEILIRGKYFLNEYVKKYGPFDIVMPRSAIPAYFTNSIKDKTQFRVLFDADGHPAEEYHEFGGLKKTSLKYKFYSKQEKRISILASHIITRSKFSIDFLSSKSESIAKDKFTIVTNGRSQQFFKYSLAKRVDVRNFLGIKNNEKVFIYIGSLGEKYGFEDAIKIVMHYIQKYTGDVKFLILTSDQDYARKLLPETLLKKTIITSVPFSEIPNYLSAADVGFSIITKAFSTKMVTPTKLGEYLLNGLPTIVSSHVGGIQDVVNEIPYSYIYNHDIEKEVGQIAQWVDGLKIDDEHRSEIREFGIKHFSIDKCADKYIEAIIKALN